VTPQNNTNLFAVHDERAELIEIDSFFKHRE